MKQLAGAAQARPAPSTADEAARYGWVERLRRDGRDGRAALQELHSLLLHAARFAVAQRRWAVPQLRGAELEEIAGEAADDALLAILRHLDDYRGESRFTTWATKFVFLEVATAIRRREWKNRQVPLDDDGATLRVETAARGPDEADAAQLLAALRAALCDALTPHQRRVFVAVCVQGVPIDVVADRLATTRGALYKTVHDARRKLRARLTLAGFAPTAKPPPEADPPCRAHRRAAEG